MTKGLHISIMATRGLLAPANMPGLLLKCVPRKDIPPTRNSVLPPNPLIQNLPGHP